MLSYFVVLFLLFPKFTGDALGEVCQKFMVAFRYSYRKQEIMTRKKNLKIQRKNKQRSYFENYDQ